MTAPASLDGRCRALVAELGLAPPAASVPAPPVGPRVEEIVVPRAHAVRGRAVGGAALATLMDALWDLAWAGLVTNDTFAALRALGGTAGPVRSRPGRLRRRGASPGGRWSAVASV